MFASMKNSSLLFFDRFAFGWIADLLACCCADADDSRTVEEELMIRMLF